MDDKSTRNFGLLIAYMVPGFVVLVGLSFSFDPVAAWLRGAGQAGPTVGSFLYVAIASVAAGMTVSALRWATIDALHEHTGLRRPRLDESRLTDRLAAFDYIVEYHYRYYQFYGNTLVSTLFAYGCWRFAPRPVASFPDWSEVALLVLVPVFIAASRDALRKYYAGGELLLGTLTKEANDDQRKAPRHHVTAPETENADAANDSGEARPRQRRKEPSDERTDSEKPESLKSPPSD